MSRRSSSISSSVCRHSPSCLRRPTLFLVLVDCLGGDQEKPRRENLTLRVVQLGGRVLDANRSGFRSQGIPNNIKPVRPAKLLGLVPLVEGHLDRAAAGVTFDFDPADLDDAGRLVDNSLGSDVESAPLVTDSLDVLGRETLGDQRSDGQILGLLLLL